MEIALSSCENCGMDICSDGNHLFDFKYADDVVVLSEGSSHLQIFLDRLRDSVGMFDMHFASSKRKVLFRY